ncbi:MAG: trehalose-6-phosphate synthase, partial [Solirubrobacteraceae bacterium]|nr:trehalose-6-phosphate synthase [Solirubrobacteraceae bacterium]
MTDATAEPTDEPTSEQPVVLVSNRGPVSYGLDGTPKRGTGGLVTALMGLASHRNSVWVASALGEGDAKVSREAGNEPISIEAPTGGEFAVRLVESDDAAYDQFYNVVSNPMLWFIQHYLWDLSNAPYIRQAEIDAFNIG